MMNSYHDKQAIDLKYLKSAEAKPYRDPRDYMNFPDKVSYEMKGQITTKATLEDREALAIYYLESIPALSALWAQAVHLFVETHSRREIDTAGIVRVGGGYKFQTDRLKYLFFTRKFSGEQLWRIHFAVHQNTDTKLHTYYAFDSLARAICLILSLLQSPCASMFRSTTFTHACSGAG